MTYNFIIIEAKQCSEYLNITSEKEFFEKLWLWTYKDDLWYFIYDENPNKEYLENYLCNSFIDENIFHNLYEDETHCYTFTVDDNGKVKTYNWNQSLLDFIYNKVKEKYGKVL